MFILELLFVVNFENDLSLGQQMGGCSAQPAAGESGGCICGLLLRIDLFFPDLVLAGGHDYGLFAAGRRDRLLRDHPRGRGDNTRVSFAMVRQ